MTLGQGAFAAQQMTVFLSSHVVSYSCAPGQTNLPALSEATFLTAGQATR